MLTRLQVENAKPKDKPVRLFDGRGLYLEISPTGGRYWTRTQHDGKGWLDRKVKRQSVLPLKVRNTEDRSGVGLGHVYVAWMTLSAVPSMNCGSGSDLAPVQIQARTVSIDGCAQERPNSDSCRYVDCIKTCPARAASHRRPSTGRCVVFAAVTDRHIGART